jgi:hypothetical protein
MPWKLLYQILRVRHGLGLREALDRVSPGFLEQLPLSFCASTNSLATRSLWDWQSEHLVCFPGRHSFKICAVAFTPDLVDATRRPAHMTLVEGP